MASNPAPVTGINQFDRFMRRYQARVPRDADRIIADTIAQMETAIKLATPVDTGNLRNSEGFRKIANLSYEVFANANYASYVEDLYTRKYQSFFYANLNRFVVIMYTRLYNAM